MTKLKSCKHVLLLLDTLNTSQYGATGNAAAFLPKKMLSYKPAPLMQRQACTYLGCRDGAALKAALPVMPRPATSALTSYVPSYVNMASMSPNAFATCSDVALWCCTWLQCLYIHVKARNTLMHEPDSSELYVKRRAIHQQHWVSRNHCNAI